MTTAMQRKRLVGVATMTPAEMIATRLQEPLETAPFIAWCEQRIQQLRRELAPEYKIGGSDETNAVAALVREIGWTTNATDDTASGVRRLHRWRNEATTVPVVERAVIEDALFHADTDIHDIYPDLAHPRGASLLGQGRRMTDKQVLAAHVLYEQGLSTRQVALLIWRKYGYANVNSCAGSLLRAWTAFGLPRRDVTEANVHAHTIHGLAAGGRVAPLYKRTVRIARHGRCDATLKDGAACPRAAQAGTTTCGYHAPAELARRRAQVERLNAQGKNTLRWANRQTAHEEAA